MAIITFAITWACMGLIQLSGRRAGGPPPVGAR